MFFLVKFLLFTILTERNNGMTDPNFENVISVTGSLQTNQ
jgi:hypothetical protein